MYVCASCAQPLFGVVRHCPFCGARQVDLGSSSGASTPIPADSGAKPLTRWGSQAEEAVQPSVFRPPPAQPEKIPAPMQAAPAAAPQATPKTPPQPPSAQPTAVQPAKPPAALPASVGTTAAPSVPAPTKSGGTFVKLIGLLLVAGTGYAGWAVFLKPKPPDACQQALDGAASAMQANQFAQAKTQALGAVARCTGESQDRAKTVLKAATEAQAVDESCGKALRLADSQVTDGRLKLAQRTLDAQPGACLSRQDATASKQRLDSNKASAAEKLTQAQNQLAGGQAEQARTSVDEAEHLDSDNADIAKVRKEVVAWKPPSVQAKSASPLPPVVPPVMATPLPVTKPPVEAPRAPPVDTAENNKLVECSTLVKAGLRALSNKSYDEAMQSAQEARAAVANCSGAADLFQSARQAKDKARQAVVIQ